jgi:hypothetical protein
LRADQLKNRSLEYGLEAVSRAAIRNANKTAPIRLTSNRTSAESILVWLAPANRRGEREKHIHKIIEGQFEMA